MKKSEQDEMEMIQRIEIPNVVGMTEEQAKKELKKLDVVIKYVNMEKKENGVVVSQSIKPKTEVYEYSELTLKINKKEENTSTKIKSTDSKAETDKSKTDEIKTKKTTHKAVILRRRLTKNRSQFTDTRCHLVGKFQTIDT